MRLHVTKPHPFDLRDRIEAFKARFEAFRCHTLEISPEGVESVLAELCAIEALAIDACNRLSQQECNRVARAEQAGETAAILAEVERPGSNVVLFPVIGRPIGAA